MGFSKSRVVFLAVAILGVIVAIWIARMFSSVSADVISQPKQEIQRALDE